MSRLRLHRRSVAAALILAAVATLMTVATSDHSGLAMAPTVSTVEGSAVHHPGELMAYHVNPDGSGYVTLISLPVGLPPAEAYVDLKAAGVPNLVDPSTRARFDPQQCYHGTAFALLNGVCPPKTWSYQGHPRPVVYFRDFTGSLWPVRAASITWNSSLAIDSWWIGSSQECPANVHCVPVYEANTPSRYCGITHYPWDAAGHLIDGEVWIRLNNYYYNNTGADGYHCNASRRSTTCHELGHALGLSHNTSLGSCLYGTSVAGKSEYPNSDDYYVLEHISY